jgi:hypothetical protein
MKTETIKISSKSQKQYLRADGTPLFTEKIASIKDIVAKHGLPKIPKKP